MFPFPKLFRLPASPFYTKSQFITIGFHILISHIPRRSMVGRCMPITDFHRQAAHKRALLRPQQSPFAKDRLKPCRSLHAVQQFRTSIFCQKRCEARRRRTAPAGELIRKFFPLSFQLPGRPSPGPGPGVWDLDHDNTHAE